MKTNNHTTPTALEKKNDVRNYALLHTELIVTDEEAKAVYHIVKIGAIHPPARRNPATLSA